MSGKMKIITLSDTHGKHWNVKVPKGDLFIFAGDAEITSLLSLLDFNEWLGTIPCKWKIVIFGNHDSYAEFIGKDECQRLLTNCIYLENESVEIEGLVIWGSPYSPFFNNWSYMKFDSELKEIWDTIPSDTDIVVTHAPCYGILDQVLPRDVSQGSLTLKNKIKEIKPKIHICAHIHEQGSLNYFDGTTRFYNVSMLDEMYNLVNKPTIIEV